MDSDVLLYENIELLFPTYEPYGMTICGISGHTNFIEINTLKDFCNFIIYWYTNPERLAELQERYKTRMDLFGYGGISDMTFLTLYGEKYPEKVYNLNTPEVEKTFDISLQHGFEFFETQNMGKIKKVQFDQHHPYCIRISDGKPVFFNTLHFQGGDSKKIMHHYVQKKNAIFFLKKNYFYLYYLFQKIKIILSGKE